MNEISRGFGTYYQTQINNLSNKLQETNVKVDKLKKENEVLSEKLDNTKTSVKCVFWMVSILFVIAIVMSLTGCGGSSNEPESINGYSLSNFDKIRDWQQRQKTVVMEPEQITYTENLYDDICFMFNNLPYLTWMYEEKDYWKTSDVTLRDEGGDCEDLGIYAYTVLVDSGIIEHYNADIFLRWYDYGNGDGHVICYILYGENQVISISNLWIFDHMYGEGDKIVADFDLYSIYVGGV